MKIRKGIALLLSLTLLCSIALPVHETYAMEDSTDGWQVSSGMNIKKTAVENENGGYTITLEAYATGSKVVTETTTDVPTDIVLVLDLSSSMTENFGTTTEASYQTYGQQNNEANYALRHNGGEENLWHKLEDGSYVSVSVTRAGSNDSYSTVSSISSYSAAYTYQEEGNTLYTLVNGTYVKVTFTKEGERRATYGYSYEGGTTTSNQNGNTNHNLTLYTLSADTSSAEYTYSYTDSEGETITIGSASIGGSTTFSTAFYKRTESGTTVTRIEALKSAVTTFCNEVAAKAAGADGVLGTDDDVKHRIAIIGYNTSASLYIGASTSTVYTSAFQDMSTSQGQANVTASINAIGTSQGTRTDEGTELANTVFGANPVPLEGEDSRYRVEIVFTDGVPSTSGSTNYTDEYAEAAIADGNTARDTYGATVYTVGIFEGADPTSAGNKNATGTNAYIAKANYFMQNLSNNKGVPPENGEDSYYLAAADADSLTEIFQQISNKIETGGASTTLNENTVIKDIIAPAFTLPVGASASDIQISTWQCTAISGNSYTWVENSGDAMNAIATVSGDTVSVNGFDFADNWVGTSTAADGTTTCHGNKLVISFDVEVQDGFLGGNGVYTNTSAGVYADSTATSPVLTYDRPQVNVDIPTVTVGETTTNVYLGADLESLSTGTIKVGDVELNPGETNYGLESWQNEYVDISITYADAITNQTVSDYSDLTEDKTYTVTVTVSPKTTSTAEDAATTQTGTASNSVNVFKPVLTYKDGTVYYGDTAPANYSGYLTSTEWKHGDTASTDVTMTGTVPTLAATYTPEANKIVDGKINTKEDIAVDVAVKIEETDVTSYVTFVHTPCTEGEAISEGAEFVLHVNTCSLTITKTGGADGEPYVFDIMKDGEKYTECSITGNGSKTIVELPIGTYTIQENGDWSWRYNGQEGSGVVLSAETNSGTITCTNTKSENYWLNGFSEVVKNIFGISSSN